MKPLRALALTTLFALGGSLPAVLSVTAPGEAPRVDAADEEAGPLDWLVGHWVGEGFGGYVEESWYAPKGGAMVGVFRMVVDDEVKLYELVTIAEGEDGLEMRLKHFDPDLSSWEAKDECLIWPLLSMDEHSARFGPVEYVLDGEGILHSSVEVEDAGGTKVEELVFRRVD